MNTAPDEPSLEDGRVELVPPGRPSLVRLTIQHPDPSLGISRLLDADEAYHLAEILVEQIRDGRAPSSRQRWRIINELALAADEIFGLPEDRG